tara:strand:+ start:5534 stop:6067 length:534 start_codon:yes stop_codon:yes gene_type:complete
MGSLSNILRLVRRAGEQAEKMAKKQLSIRRKGNRFPMNTYGLLSDSIEFKLKTKGHLANLTLESFEEGLLLNDGIIDVPYTKGSGAKTSQYIHGLAVWAAKKFYGGNYKQGLRAAFRIAKTQKTNLGANSSFAQAPANPGWMDEIRDKIDRELNEILTIDTMIAVNLDVMSALNKKI